MCRPSTVDQRFWYTGYKKLFGFKFQAISTLDGLITSLAGPTTAADGDWALWHKLELEIILRDLFSNVEEDTKPLLFGDLAYKGAYGIIGAYVRQLRRPLTNTQHAFNRSMLSI
jgi:hypothetical protein